MVCVNMWLDFMSAPRMSTLKMSTPKISTFQNINFPKYQLPKMSTSKKSWFLVSRILIPTSWRWFDSQDVDSAEIVSEVISKHRHVYIFLGTKAYHPKAIICCILVSHTLMMMLYRHSHLSHHSHFSLCFS